MDATTTVLDVSLFNNAASYHISICTPKHTNTIGHVSDRPYTILMEVKYKVEEMLRKFDLFEF